MAGVTFNLRPLRDILAEYDPNLEQPHPADVDEMVLGVQEWLRQPDIVAVMYEGLIESGTQLLTGAQLALIREAGRK